MSDATDFMLGLQNYAAWLAFFEELETFASVVTAGPMQLPHWQGTPEKRGVYRLIAEHGEFQVNGVDVVPAIRTTRPRGYFPTVPSSEDLHGLTWQQWLYHHHYLHDYHADGRLIYFHLGGDEHVLELWTGSEEFDDYPHPTRSGVTMHARVPSVTLGTTGGDVFVYPDDDTDVMQAFATYCAGAEMVSVHDHAGSLSSMPCLITIAVSSGSSVSTSSSMSTSSSPSSSESSQS